MSIKPFNTRCDDCNGVLYPIPENENGEWECERCKRIWVVDDETQPVTVFENHRKVTEEFMKLNYFDEVDHEAETRKIITPRMIEDDEAKA